MTDTAKPTLGPWYFCSYPAGNGGFVYAGGPGGPTVCDVSQYEMPKQNGEFIAEAGTVYHETNLTPRQLLERVRELEEVLTLANTWLVRPISNHIDHADPEDNDPIYQQVVDTMRAALGKHGEEVS